MEGIRLEQFEKIGENLYKTGAGYWRLFADDITPNGCWLVNPEMRELKDIDIATGEYVYGDAVIEFEYCGTVSACNQFIPKNRTVEL